MFGVRLERAAGAGLERAAGAGGGVGSVAGCI